MCKDLQENRMDYMKFLNTKTMFMNRGGHDLKTTNYGEHFTVCNPELTSETCACRKMDFNI